MLQWVGAIDMLLSGLILVTRWRIVLIYIVAWGLITAVGRTAGGGLGRYPETLLRLVHAGGPLAVYLEWFGASTQPITAIINSSAKTEHT